MNSSFKDNLNILSIIVILGIIFPLFVIIAMAVYVYPNNDGIIAFIIKYRFLLGL